jgi:hypothetical protein
MEAPRHWRLQQQRYAMVGEKCPYCGVKIFPPRDICPNLGCEKDTFTLPLTTPEKRQYYAEKGVIVEEKIGRTRINLWEIFYGE